MSLADWHRNGWLKPHRTSPREIADLMAIVARDLEDSSRDISPDWRFGIAYNAVLKLCAVLLAASGYQVVKGGGLQHFRTLAALPLVFGEHRKADATYLDSCRMKRNIVEYEMVGGATDHDAVELRDFALVLLGEVRAWLKSNHPGLWKA